MTERPSPYPRDVHLEKQGLNKVLGERESSIMELLWGRTDVSVREIHDALAERERIAYTTVMTIADRLWKKGLLSRRKQGNAYLYTPTQSRESFVTRCLKRVFGAFVPDLNPSALSHFVDSLADTQPELLDELERLIERKREARDG